MMYGELELEKSLMDVDLMNTFLRTLTMVVKNLLTNLLEDEGEKKDGSIAKFLRTLDT